MYKLGTVKHIGDGFAFAAADDGDVFVPFRSLPHDATLRRGEKILMSVRPNKKGRAKWYADDATPTRSLQAAGEGIYYAGYGALTSVARVVAQDESCRILAPLMASDVAELEVGDALYLDRAFYSVAVVVDDREVKLDDARSVINAGGRLIVQSAAETARQAANAKAVAEKQRRDEMARLYRPVIATFAHAPYGGDVHRRLQRAAAALGWREGEYDFEDVLRARDMQGTSSHRKFTDGDAPRTGERRNSGGDVDMKLRKRLHEQYLDSVDEVPAYQGFVNRIIRTHPYARVAFVLTGEEKLAEFEDYLRYLARYGRVEVVEV